MRKDGLVVGLVLVLASSFVAKDYYSRLLACMGLFPISNPYPGYCGTPSLPSILYIISAMFMVLTLLGVVLIAWSVSQERECSER